MLYKVLSSIIPFHAIQYRTSEFSIKEQNTYEKLFYEIQYVFTVKSCDNVSCINSDITSLDNTHINQTGKQRD